MKNIFILLLLACSGLLSAQSTFEVTGQLKDAQTKDALEFCPVAVFNVKDSLITSAVTNNNGFFTLNLNPGRYRFLIKYIGYQTDTIKAVMVTESKFMGVIKLNPEVNNLNTVTIQANSHEALIDRDEQVVTAKMRAGASNAKDLLEKVNGVQYDRYNNKIKVDNNDKVIMLVDGLEKDQEYIKNLSPDRIKKIEVIRSPGGRYGLEGYSAVINIILKKDYRGTEVYVSDRTMVKPDAAKPEYIPVQNNVSASVNYVYNSLNIYGTGFCNYNNFNLQTTSEKSYANGLTINNTLPTPNSMNGNIHQLLNSGTLGADYSINPKHTISFEGNVESQPGAYNISRIANQLITSNNGVVSDIQNLQTNNTSDGFNTRNSLFYVGKFDENNELTSNFTYYTHRNTYTNLFTDNVLFSSNEQGVDTKNSTKFYLEYLHTFKNKSSLQLGYGNTWESQNNTFKTDSTSSRFLYSDIRHKLYAYYSLQLTKKLGVKFGGAGESSSRDADGQSNSYFIFEPFANIQYKPSGLIDFNLKYRSESNYPGIDQTNPFTVVIDQQSERIGNPYLTPDVLHKISLIANVLGGLIQIEPYYNFSPNYITESGALLPNDIFQYSYSNVGLYQIYGTQIRTTAPLGKNTHLYLQSDADFFSSSINYNGKTNNLNDWNMSSQLIYQSPKTNTVFGLKYQKNLTRIITAQGYQTSDNDYWITFVQAPLLKNKLNVMLLYFIPLDLGVNYDQGGFIQTNGYTETKASNISFLKNMVMLQISYRFNKGKSANKKEKNVEQDDQKKKGVF